MENYTFLGEKKLCFLFCFYFKWQVCIIPGIICFDYLKTLKHIAMIQTIAKSAVLQPWMQRSPWIIRLLNRKGHSVQQVFALLCFLSMKEQGCQMKCQVLLFPSCLFNGNSLKFGISADAKENLMCHWTGSSGYCREMWQLHLEVFPLREVWD